MGEIENAAAAIMKGWTFNKGKVPTGGEKFTSAKGGFEELLGTLNGESSTESSTEEKEGFGAMELGEATIGELEGLNEDTTTTENEGTWMTKADEKAWKEFGESRNKKESNTKSATGSSGESKQGSEGESATEGAKESMKKEIEKAGGKADTCETKLRIKENEIAQLKAENAHLKAQAVIMKNEVHKAADRANKAEMSEVKLKASFDALKAEQERVLPEGMTLEDYLDSLETQLFAYKELIANPNVTHSSFNGICRVCKTSSPSLSKENRFDPANHEPDCPLYKLAKTT